MNPVHQIHREQREGSRTQSSGYQILSEQGLKTVVELVGGGCRVGKYQYPRSTHVLYLVRLVYRDTENYPVTPFRVREKKT